MPSDLQATLDELTAYPSTDQPFLSVYLDWQPDGQGNRQALTVIQQEFDLIHDRLRERGSGIDSFDADRQRIMDYLNTDAPKDAQALAIFACNAEGVWTTQPLQAPVETHIVEDRYPHTFTLARILDDYETYAVVLADSQESRIFVIALNAPQKVGETEASEQINRFEAGGWAQMLFQRRTDNLIKAHTKDISAKLERLMKRYDVQHVIIAGNDSIKGIVMNTLSNHVKDKLVDYINLDIDSNMQAIMEAIEPMMREVEREQEEGDVDTLEMQVNTKGGLGCVGVADTAMALSKGQVRMLLMLQSFNAVGRECPHCGMLFAGMGSKCPYDGNELQERNFREGFTARAQQQGATMQIIEANDYLDQHEGVGALLWYRDDERPAPEQALTA